MVKIVGVRFKKSGKTYYFDPANIDVKKGDFVIVETVRGLEFGEVVIGIKDIAEENIVSPLKPVIRVATEEDKKTNEKNKQKEKEAFNTALKKIEEHGLDMKLIDVEYTFDVSKIIFYFSAEGRIDFRELVKDLAAIFRTRIELRQIGVRDEAKLLGGLGPCGRELCCKKFLGDFQTVSIKMVKNQGLSLNPSKISGTCGRLMCCLNYEQAVYEEKIKRVPGVGSIVSTEKGEGVVMSNNILKETISVRLKGQEEVDLETFDVKDIKIIKKVVDKQREDGNIEELKQLED